MGPSLSINVLIKSLQLLVVECLYQVMKIMLKKLGSLLHKLENLNYHYEHKELGYNYRMSNLLAAVGRGQLELIEEVEFQKEDIFLINIREHCPI